MAEDFESQRNGATSSGEGHIRGTRELKGGDFVLEGLSLSKMTKVFTILDSLNGKLVKGQQGTNHLAIEGDKVYVTRTIRTPMRS